MGFGEDWLLARALLLLPLFLSLGVHEWAHAWTAWRLGDDTAALQGRLTLDPLAHLDPIGTLLLPLLGVPFGWAKPVPLNPARFRADVRMETGLLWTAAAGPLANLVLAFAAALLLGLLVRFELVAAGSGGWQLLEMAVLLNLLLAAFNSLPIPPLDGSRVADALVPERLRPAWEAFGSLGPFALAALILLPALAGVQLFFWPLEGGRLLLDAVLAAVAG